MYVQTDLKRTLHALLVTETAFLCPFEKDIVVEDETGSFLHVRESGADQNVVVPLVILRNARFAPQHFRRVGCVILRPALGVADIFDFTIDKQIVREYGVFRVAPDTATDQDIVVDQDGAVIHFEKDRSSLRMINNVAGDPSSLVAEIHPDAEGTLNLMVDTPNEIAADNGVDALVELDGGRFPSAKFFSVVSVLDQVVGDDTACCPTLTGDSRLSTATNDIVADDVRSESCRCRRSPHQVLAPE